MNDWSNNKALKQNSELAKSKIFAELENNEVETEEAYSSHKKIREIFIFLGQNLEEDRSLISLPNEVKKFKNEHPSILIIKDSIRIDSLRFKYKGEINLNLNLKQLNLKTIAWKTFQNSKISSLYDFNCLMYLETIYNLTEEIKDNNKILLEYLTNEKNQGENHEKSINHLKLLIDFEKIGIETLKEKNLLKSCG